jgi:hypothetical protein
MPSEAEAFEILREVAAKYQDEFESIYRAILLDLLRLPAAERLSWADLLTREVVAGLGVAEGRAWNRSVQARWLDACLERGFAYDFPAENSD